ncbi:MAG: hypothetical protein MUQ10_02680 [Anaerolineae bacterium]|nr:hypothetical protein [Anaerolineae bacterium]
MNHRSRKIRSAVRRDHAEDYILTSLVAFAATVVFTRAFLQLTGFPQIGNSVLHVAHAMWGGLFLVIAVYLPLAYANRWAIELSALLGGIGIGLFIDEVGKFITQANDYFFPPALPLIYGIILLNVLMYIHFRRPHNKEPRDAMYRVIEGLQDALDGDLDTAEADRIENQLAIAQQSDRTEIVNLAHAIGDYLHKEQEHLATAEPDFWKRVVRHVDAFGRLVGRRLHGVVVTALLIVWVVFVIGYIVVLIRGGADIDLQVLEWRGVLIAVQVAIGCFMLVALVAWLTNKEDRGLQYALGGFLLSLVAFQSLQFYLSQFSAVTATLLQLVILQILLAYRRWYLRD